MRCPWQWVLSGSGLRCCGWIEAPTSGPHREAGPHRLCPAPAPGVSVVAGSWMGAVAHPGLRGGRLASLRPPGDTGMLHYRTTRLVRWLMGPSVPCLIATSKQIRDAQALRAIETSRTLGIGTPFCLMLPINTPMRLTTPCVPRASAHGLRTSTAHPRCTGGHARWPP